MDIASLLHKIYREFAREADNGGEDTAFEIFVEVLDTAKEMAQALAEDDINDISENIRQKAEVACEFLYEIIDRMEE